MHVFNLKISLLCFCIHDKALSYYLELSKLQLNPNLILEKEKEAQTSKEIFTKLIIFETKTFCSSGVILKFFSEYKAKQFNLGHFQTCHGMGCFKLYSTFSDGASEAEK